MAICSSSRTVGTPAACTARWYLCAPLVVAWACLVLAWSPAATAAAADGYGQCVSTGPDAGRCQNFNFGGTSGVHWYTCCNDCTSKTAPTCDGTTYQGGSNNSYCGSCGANTGTPAHPGCRTRGSFTCMGCAGQAFANSVCRTWFRDFPGVCWWFSSCFRSNCRQLRDAFAHVAGSRDAPQAVAAGALHALIPNPTCGNGACDHGETRYTCPLDCCGAVEPVCKNANYTSGCTPACCGDSSCCTQQLVAGQQSMQLGAYTWTVPDGVTAVQVSVAGGGGGGGAGWQRTAGLAASDGEASTLFVNGVMRCTGEGGPHGWPGAWQTGGSGHAGNGFAQGTANGTSPLVTGAAVYPGRGAPGGAGGKYNAPGDQASGAPGGNGGLCTMSLKTTPGDQFSGTVGTGGQPAPDNNGSAIGAGAAGAAGWVTVSWCAPQASYPVQVRPA